MRNVLKALAVFTAVSVTATALGQDTTTGANPLAALGALGPILIAVFVFFWAQWGGFRLFTGNF